MFAIKKLFLAASNIFHFVLDAKYQLFVSKTTKTLVAVASMARPQNEIIHGWHHNKKCQPGIVLWLAIKVLFYNFIIHTFNKLLHK